MTKITIKPEEWRQMIQNSSKYPDELQAEFDRALAAHDVEIAAKALEEAADAAEITDCPCSYAATPGRFCVQHSHHHAHAHAGQLRARAAALRASTGGENK